MVFEETITILNVFCGLTIAINCFPMVFDLATIAFNGLGPLVNDAMVSMDRRGLTHTHTHTHTYTPVAKRD